MEDEKKLVKVYSNNSKKSRLKRRKNKFQRIWDTEKQTYIKVRKTKYPVPFNKVRKDWRKEDNSKALKRRHKTPKKTKSVPVNATKQKTETKQKARIETVRINGKNTKPVTFNMCGIKHVWDSQTLQYKRAA